MKILVLGGASYDEIIHVNEFFEATSTTTIANESYSTPGSTGVGKALALKKLGFDVAFQAIIGRDIYGKFISDTIKNAGIEFYPHYVDKTERHTNTMDKHGHRISIFNTIADESDIYVDVYEKLIKDSDIVCLNIINYCRYFIPLIKKHNKPIFCDIHDYDGKNPHHKDFIESSDYIFMSSDNLFEYRTYMEKLITKGKQWVVVTHAEKGATYLSKNSGFIDIPGNEIDILDTNGAGDNFFAGFLYGYLNNLSPLKSLKLGRLSAETCIKSKNIVSSKLNLKYLLKNH
ncbi:PfkB family carbohydrate kinase [Mycoplasmatota bacterium WC30]